MLLQPSLLVIQVSAGVNSARCMLIYCFLAETVSAAAGTDELPTFRFRSRHRLSLPPAEIWRWQSTFWLLQKMIVEWIYRLVLVYSVRSNNG
jgi:hypothetical protein